MLEPLEARYTKQRQTWLENSVPNILEGEYEFIYWDSLTDKIEVGTVLDAYSTNYYKFSQLQKIIEMLRSDEIKNWDTLWFADLWFPGIESIPYICALTGKQVFIKWVLHSGTWDRDDFTYRYGMSNWARGFEETVISIASTIYVGSQYHKELIYNDIGRDKCKNKIEVTGLFFEDRDVVALSGYDDNKFGKKDNLVVFPHRLVEEKHPKKFDALRKHFVKTHPEYQFVKTMEATKNKKEYYELLSRAKFAISFDGQETFGYSILECMSVECIPLVFNWKSYTDTVPKELRRDNMLDLAEMLERFSDNFYDEDYMYDMRRKMREHAIRYRTEVVLSLMFAKC